MKESLWLKDYERETKSKRNDSNSKKKIILIVIPVMMLLFLGAAMLGGNSSAAQGQSTIGYFLIIFIFLMAFAIVMIGVGKKKDVTKHTRENVMALLRSDAEVYMFDQQMSMPPIKEVKISSETTIFLTQDYIGKKYWNMGDLNYDFIHRRDVISYNYAKTASTTANLLNAAYFFDIRGIGNNVIMNGLADSGAQLAELEELLHMAQPAIRRG